MNLKHELNLISAQSKEKNELSAKRPDINFAATCVSQPSWWAFPLPLFLAATYNTFRPNPQETAHPKTPHG